MSDIVIRAERRVACIVPVGQRLHEILDPDCGLF
jgi:hypothetical protein